MKFAERRRRGRAGETGLRAGTDAGGGGAGPSAGTVPARESRSVLAAQRVIRRERQRLVRRRLAAGGLAGLALVGAVAALDVWLPRADLFPLAAVDVRVAPPGHHVSREAVLALARVRTGTPLLALDLDAIAERVGRHPWVAAVAVRRELPARLVIEVEERQPAAVVRLDRLYFADRAGRLFKPVERGEEADLPVVTGLTVERLADDPGGVAARLVEGLALVEAVSAKVGLAVSELHLDPVDGFVLRTGARPGGAVEGGGAAAAAPGLTVIVGEGQFGPKLDRLGRVLAHLAESGVEAESIDLTLGSRAVVRPRVPPPGVAGPSAAGGLRPAGDPARSRLQRDPPRPRTDRRRPTEAPAKAGAARGGAEGPTRSRPGPALGSA